MITDTVPEATTPLAIARALAPRIRERAAEIEATRQLPRELVLEIASARLFRVALPEAEGGLGADVLTTLHVIEEVARADGSTGWCLAMGINTLRQSAQFAPEVRREIFFMIRAYGAYEHLRSAFCEMIAAASTSHAITPTSPQVLVG